jgi:hypothetical protein
MIRTPSRPSPVPSAALQASTSTSPRMVAREPNSSSMMFTGASAGSGSVMPWITSATRLMFTPRRTPGSTSVT